MSLPGGARLGSVTVGRWRYSEKSGDSRFSWEDVFEQAPCSAVPEGWCGARSRGTVGRAEVGDEQAHQ